MEQNLLTTEQTRNLLFQGKFIFTIQSKKTSKRFTYKIIQPKDNKKQTKVFFVSVQTGPSNLKFGYFGHIWLDENTGKSEFNFAKVEKAKVKRDAEQVKFFTYFLHELMAERLEGRVDIYHSGHCARCGKRLTTPESVKLGIGPECIKMQKRF